jgi:hypothetical protein
MSAWEPIDREAVLARLGLRLLLKATPLLHTGKRIGMLTLLEYRAGSAAPKKHATWLCRCDCGATSEPHVKNLLAGRTRSCGCRQGFRT